MCAKGSRRALLPTGRGPSRSSGRGARAGPRERPRRSLGQIARAWLLRRESGGSRRLPWTTGGWASRSASAKINDPITPARSSRQQPVAKEGARMGTSGQPAEPSSGHRPSSAFAREDLTVLAALHLDGRTKVLRAVRRGDGRTVIVKALDPQACRRQDLERLRHEYEVGASLDVDAAVRPIELVSYDGMPALLLEDFGGELLGRLLDAPMPIETFLDLAVRIAGAIAEVHGRGVVHKDLKPENILVHPTTLEVKIADFGIASLLPREAQAGKPPALIEGSLPYMSPEQTGR